MTREQLETYVNKKVYDQMKGLRDSILNPSNKWNIFKNQRDKK